MPDAIAASARTISIHGLTFAYARTYSPGHTCTAAEAEALEIARGENLRNNFARRIQAACAFAKVDAATELPQRVIVGLGADFAEYERTYVLGAARSASKPDPVQSTARKLAREAIANKLRASGADPRSRDAEWYDAQIESVLASQPWFKEEAQRRLEAAKEAAEQIMNLEL